MNSKTVNSMRNLCRTCMTRFSKTQRESAINNKQSIHEVPTGSKEASLIELLQLVQPQIKVEINDNLPKLICTDCIKKLLMIHEFIEMYKNVDKKFRNMLKQVGTTNSRRDVKASKESIEIIEVNDEPEEVIEKEDDIYEITKYEIEVEEINIEKLDKEVNVSEWPEFDDEPLRDISEEAEDKEFFTNPYSDEKAKEKELYFTNPYSDASDNEWTPNGSGKKQTTLKPVTKKRKSNESDDTALKIPSKKKPKKKISNKRDTIVKDIQLSVENKDSSFPCQECETVFDSEKLLQEHMRFHRMGKLCKRKYKKKSDKPSTNQIDHMGYECNLCGKVFSKSTSYKIHMRVHTGEEPYLCIECGKGFKVMGSLTTHMRRHRGEKNVQCPHCPKKFVCSSGLYGHMMVHTTEKPFVCDICGAAFHMAYMLRKHNLYHNGIKNYPCEYCDMRFVTAEKCRRHMRTHTGEKPYGCKYCERAFAQSNDCVKHLRQHLGDNVYQCELCPLRFPLARDLRVHFATPKDDDEETRVRFLQARLEEEQNLRDKLGLKET